MTTRLLVRSLAARRARMGLALLAVTVGVTVAVALATLALDVGDDLSRTLRRAGPNFLVVPAGAVLELAPPEGGTAPAGLALPDSIMPRLKQSYWKHNILAAQPELTLRVRCAGESIELVGTWFEDTVATADGPWRTGLSALQPAWTLEGRWPRAGADELALGAELAERLDRRPGQRVEIEFERHAVQARVTAVFQAGGLDDRRAFAPLAMAQRLSGRAGEIDRVALSALVLPAPRGTAPDPATDPAGYERWMCAAYPENVAQDLENELPGTDVLQRGEVIAGEAGVVRRLNLLMVLLALAALAASTLGLLATTRAGVVQRAAELALLRVLGASPAQLATLLLVESLLLALAGGTLGWGLGALAAVAIRGDAFGSHLAPSLLLLPAAIVIAIGVALAATLEPLREALALDPAQVLRD